MTARKFTHLLVSEDVLEEVGAAAEALGISKRAMTSYLIDLERKSSRQRMAARPAGVRKPAVMTVEDHAFVKAEAKRIGMPMNRYFESLVDKYIRGGNPCL